MSRRWHVLFYYLDPVVKPQDDIKKKKIPRRIVEKFYMRVVLCAVCALRYINIKKLAILKLLFYH